MSRNIYATRDLETKTRSIHERRTRILRPGSNDTATRGPSCRFLMSTTRDIVRRFEVSISDLSRPRLVVAVVPLTRSGTARYTAWLQVLIALRGCDRSAPFATGHEFVGVYPEELEGRTPSPRRLRRDTSVGCRSTVTLSLAAIASFARSCGKRRCD